MRRRRRLQRRAGTSSLASNSPRRRRRLRVDSRSRRVVRRGSCTCCHLQCRRRSVLAGASPSNARSTLAPESLLECDRDDDGERDCGVAAVAARGSGPLPASSARSTCLGASRGGQRRRSPGRLTTSSRGIEVRDVPCGRGEQLRRRRARRGGSRVSGSVGRPPHARFRLPPARRARHRHGSPSVAQQRSRTAVSRRRPRRAPAPPHITSVHANTLVESGDASELRRRTERVAVRATESRVRPPADDRRRGEHERASARERAPPETRPSTRRPRPGERRHREHDRECRRPDARLLGDGNPEAVVGCARERGERGESDPRTDLGRDDDQTAGMRRDARDRERAPSARPRDDERDRRERADARRRIPEDSRRQRAWSPWTTAASPQSATPSRLLMPTSAYTARTYANATVAAGAPEPPRVLEDDRRREQRRRRAQGRPTPLGSPRTPTRRCRRDRRGAASEPERARGRSDRRS